MKKSKNRLVDVHSRLFAEDVEQLKAIAEAEGSKWQIELRQLVRRALRNQTRARDNLIIKDRL